jgi:hypothetical protein
MEINEAVDYIGHDGIKRQAFVVATPADVNPPAPDEAEAEVLAKFGYPPKHAAANGGLDLADGEVVLVILDKTAHRWSGYTRRAQLSPDDGAYRRVEGNYRIKNGGSYREPAGDDGDYGY